VVSFTPRPLYPADKSPCTHWIGGWLGPRAGLDDVENRKFLNPAGLKPPTPLSSRQSLFRLSYPDSSYSVTSLDFINFIICTSPLLLNKSVPRTYAVTDESKSCGSVMQTQFINSLQWARRFSWAGTTRDMCLRFLLLPGLQTTQSRVTMATKTGFFYPDLAWKCLGITAEQQNA
jgi:hypothetical protein